MGPANVQQEYDGGDAGAVYNLSWDHNTDVSVTGYFVRPMAFGVGCLENMLINVKLKATHCYNQHWHPVGGRLGLKVRSLQIGLGCT
jgi:hypothetical protein